MAPNLIVRGGSGNVQEILAEVVEVVEGEEEEAAEEEEEEEALGGESRGGHFILLTTLLVDFRAKEIHGPTIN
ncbi:unnamed protein product [Clonostachys rosea f. rosea IK726]|uniref:Uncharacterized protein n=1 Tax=Clonostachys rosea f. rosea IK726 TaxID=1349383 RepID=A0ACA9T6T6_BIOOC|nr:unnamed protein product [Clonostachys rosea f. rosea IK726]